MAHRIHHQLLQLKNLVESVSDSVYTTPISILSDATIGQHSRHIVEILLCLENGYETAKIDYENRKRDLRYNHDRRYLVDSIESYLKSEKREDKIMHIHNGNENEKAVTSYNREVIYNTDHIIHHLALIKVALKSLGIENIPEDFGVAYSTLQYRSTQCAQ